MKSYFTLFALVAVCISSSSAQWRQQQQPYSRSSCGNCACPDENKPFCGTDGRQETTYRSKCHLECDQGCNAGLRVKFEGVCAEPYVEGIRGSKNLGGNNGFSNSLGSSFSRQPTRRPTQPFRTTQRPYSPGFQTTRSPYPSRNPIQTTIRPNFSGYTTTTRRTLYAPNSPQEPFRTTRRPLTFPRQSTTFRSAIVDYRTNSPFQGGQAVPYTVPTTSQPWWQSAQSRSSQSQPQQRYNYPSSSSSNGYGRQNREIEDDDY